MRLQCKKLQFALNKVLPFDDERGAECCQCVVDAFRFLPVLAGAAGVVGVPTELLTDEQRHFALGGQDDLHLL